MTLTHGDLNVIMAALDNERETLKQEEIVWPEDFERIARVEAKIQAARGRMWKEAAR